MGQAWGRQTPRAAENSRGYHGLCAGCGAGPVCVCVALWERERMNDEVDGESTRRRREAEKSCVVVWIGEPERVIDCRDTSSGSSGNF